MIDVILPTRSGIEIRKRCLSKPTDHQQILLDRLQLQLPKINQRKCSDDFAPATLENKVHLRLSGELGLDRHFKTVLPKPSIDGIHLQIDGIHLQKGQML